MKRKAALLIAAFMIISLALPLAAFAGGLYDEASPRLIDSGEALDEAYAQDLINESQLFSEKYEMDIVFVIVTPDEYRDCRGRLGSMADDIYDAGRYGWGEDRSAAIVLWCPEYEEYHYQAYGRASELIDEDEIEFISERSPGYQEEYGDWGVLYASLRLTSNYLDDLSEAVNTLPPDIAGLLQDGQLPDQGLTVSEDPQPISGEKPYWYPENVAGFQFFHDENAPRVVDNADIFTPEEEAAIEARAWEIIERTGKDVVVFTDTSSYGLEQNVYCADFYDFNGYGFGPEREGLCLLFCMDPNDRGFMTVATGSETRALFTQSSSNSMDGLLYDYAVSARYGEGVLSWMDTVESLYTKGVPFAPDWLPDAGEGFVRFHRGEGKGPSGYIDDKAGFFTEEEARALSAKAERISREYGIDILIHTTRDSYGMSRTEYNELYYLYNGLGEGDSYDGMLLAGYPYSARMYMYSEGSVSAKLTEVNRERIEDHCADHLNDYEEYEAFDTALDDLEHMMKTGRVQRSLSSWIGTGALGSALGGIFGGASFGAAKSTMKTPRTKTSAREYVRSFRLLNQSDVFLYTSTSSVYDPPQRSSGGGGGSGGGHSSSYHSSFSGSSGASHSSSGSKF